MGEVFLETALSHSFYFKD